MLISFILLVSAVHRYNERRTSSLLAILVTIPFTIITLVVRILAASIILGFHPSTWSVLVISGLSLGLLVVNLACRVKNSNKSNEEDDDGDDSAAACCASKVCTFVLFKLPRLLIKAVGNIFIPLGYGSDEILGQNVMHGSWQIGLNFLLCMICLGAGITTAVLHHVPNTYHGLEMAKMGMMVEIPETNVIVKTGSGMDIQVITRVDISDA